MKDLIRAAVALNLEGENKAKPKPKPRRATTASFLAGPAARFKRFLRLPLASHRRHSFRCRSTRAPGFRLSPVDSARTLPLHANSI